MTDLVLSPSALSRLDDCERSYAIRYVDRAPGGGAWDPESAALGTLVHAVLEAAGAAVIAGGTWPAATKDRRALLRAGLLSIAPPPTRAVAAREILDAAAPALDLARVRAVEHRILDGWMLRTPSGPVPMRGIIDRVDDEPGRLVVVDYKTGRDVPSSDELEEDLQAGIYLIYAREMLGGGTVTVVGRWLYLARGRSVDVAWSPDLDAYVRRAVAERWRRVRARVDAGQGSAIWPARAGGHCRGCPAIGTCDVALAAAVAPARAPDAQELLTALPDAALLARRREAAEAATLAESIRAACDKVLRPRVVAAGGALEAAGYRVGLATRTSAGYPERDRTVEGLALAAEVHPDEVRAAVTSIDSRAVERWIAGLGDGVSARVRSAATALAVYDASTHLQGRAMRGDGDEEVFA